MTSREQKIEKKKIETAKMSKNMREKLAITGVVILLALIALIVKLYSIQNEYSDEYNQKILSQQRYDSREIPYRRGDITDRNGTFLASSTKVYNLIIDASQINSSQEDYLDPTLNLLNEVYGYSTEDIRGEIMAKPDSQYIRYAKQLSYDEMMEFETRKEEVNAEYKSNGDTHRVYGVWFEDSYLRYYPNGSLASSVIGFSFSEGQEGNGGIEQYYNDELIGKAGREYGYLNDDSNLERVIKEPEDGHTIVSTIDTNIQTIVEKYIARFQEETGSKTTAVIVMDPQTGEVLAMADNRPYNLNDPRNIDAYYTELEQALMSEEELSKAWYEIWRNYCISDTYEPGSTSKIFTVAAALEEGTISGNETYMCDGFQEVSGWKIKCNNVNGHGLLTVQEAIMQSCNDAMMQIVAGLGRDRFTKFMKVFGFGSKTGIDLPGEADTSSLVHSAATMVASDLATNSFGQNYNCTMIQMASGYSSIINGGSYYEPHVVKQILNKDGSVLKEVEPKLVCETVSSGTSDFIKTSLIRTVNEGTGGGAQIVGYEIGGKTGTGEKYPRGTGNYLVSFAGFAPLDNPQVLCYVIVDEPNVEDQAHSSYASGIFRDIMKEILPYMNIFREYDDSYYGEEENGSGSDESVISTPVSKPQTEDPAQTHTDNANTGTEVREKETKAPEQETKAPKVYEREEVIQHEENADGGDNTVSPENIPGTPPGVDSNGTVIDPNLGFEVELVPSL